MQDVNSIQSQAVTRVNSKLHVGTSTLLLQTPVLPLQLQHVLSLAGWNAAFCPDGDAFSLSPLSSGHYCPYTVNPGGGWARDLPCCVHCQAPVWRKTPAEKWDYKGWFKSSRSSLATTWQTSNGEGCHMSKWIAVSTKSGCWLHWGIALGAQPQLCSSLPVWLSPAKNLPCNTSYPASPSLCFLSQSAS